MTDSKGAKPDIYTRITTQNVAALEQGVKPWTQPWNAAHAAGHVSRPLRFSGQPYSGINVLTLWASAMERHYAAPIWMTFKQAIELGGHVRKGEKGSPVVYANTIVRTAEGDNGEDEERTIPFLKAYTVFNVDQIDGLPAHYHAIANADPNPDERDAHAESFFTATVCSLQTTLIQCFLVSVSCRWTRLVRGRILSTTARYFLRSHQPARERGHRRHLSSPSKAILADGC